MPGSQWEAPRAHEQMPVLTASSANPDAHAAMQDLDLVFAGHDIAFVLLFASPGYDLKVLAQRSRDSYPSAEVIGCTTAGELGPTGYESGTLVGLAFQADFFAIKTRLIRNLSDFSVDDGAGIASDVLSPDGMGASAVWPGHLAILLVDGLSRQEDAVVASLAPYLGDIPLVGGSAGDGLNFGETFVLHGGAFHGNAAVVASVRTRCDVMPFRIDNFVPTDKRMVVTGADPAQRLVTEINAEPAAREYARIVGKDPNQLSPFIFAEHPVVVRIGDDSFCRSIQKVEKNGDLRFYCAIDEGLVLTVADSEDIVSHLDASLSRLSSEREPSALLTFDCILRRLDVEGKQRVREMSDVLVRHGVVGFNTYGEQFGGMHVNQTFTGAAIYPPESTP